MSSTPLSPYRTQQIASKWKCSCCGNYNSLKKKKCPKCNSTNTEMSSIDDIGMLYEIELNRKCFIKKSRYLQLQQIIWTKNIIKDKNINIMKNESNLNPCKYNELEQCPCAERAVFIMYLYRDWCIAHHKRKKKKNNKRRKKPKSDITTLIKNDIAKEHTLTPTKIKDMGKPSLSIGDILGLLKHYNLTQLIEDCNHIDKIHTNYDHKNKKNKYAKIFKFFQSQLGECKKDECNIFLRSNRPRTNDSDVLNRKNLYYGFINSNDIAIITTLDTFHTFWFHSYNLYKIDAEKSYKTLRSLDDKYDDEYDNKYDGNDIKDMKHMNINTSKFITKINKENFELGQHFEFGEHFEYWKFYSKYDNFIPNYYNTLKEELLNNNIYAIDKLIYDDIISKVNLLINTSIIRKMKALRNFYNEIAQIYKNDIITKEHLICIMIYTNNNEIQRKYKQTLRLDLIIGNKIDKNDTVYHEKYIELKHKNSQIANWCRLLFESVRFWGTIMTENDFFFHGIDRRLLFDKFYATFKCPISTSTNICVAQSFKDNSDGIIIKVNCSSEKSMIPFLDVSFISDFRMESERLFYGADLNIIDIYYKKFRFDYMLRALSLFQCIISGGYFTHNKKLINNKNQKRLISLIENYLKYYNKNQLIYPKNKKNKNKKNNNKKPPPMLKHQKSISDVTKNKPIKQQRNKPTTTIFQERPLSKVKSSSSLKSNKRTLPLIYNKKHNDDDDDEKKIYIKKTKKRKYHHELFDYCISSRQNSDIWLCRTEILGKLIIPRLQKYFIKFDENSENIQSGNFAKFWEEKWNVNIKYSQEFDWPINKKNLDTFMHLPSGDLIQSPRYLYTLINNKSLSDIQFYAECCRWSKDDPGWCDFYWNVEQLPKGVSEIQVIIDVCCQEDNNNNNNQHNKNRIISHDIYEGEWMSLDEEQEQSYFGGKAFAILEEFYDDNYDNRERRGSEPRLNPPKILQFRWKMSVRVSTIAYTPVDYKTNQY